MDQYLLFFIIAVITIMSPGPGVVLTLSNTVRYGFTHALSSILGIACGTFIIAGISATSLGVILATSSIAFTVIKYIGAAYLLYLGIKLWRAPAVDLAVRLKKSPQQQMQKRFFEGLLMQLSNPKAVFFFIAVFPQFIDLKHHYSIQFLLLVSTYSILVISIHIIYALLAARAQYWLASPTGSRVVNRLSATAFMGFGIGLANANR